MLSAGNMSVDVVTYVITGAPAVARRQVQRAGLNEAEKTMGALSATEGPERSGACCQVTHLPRNNEKKKKQRTSRMRPEQERLGTAVLEVRTVHGAQQEHCRHSHKNLRFKTCLIPDQGNMEKMKRINQNPERG